MCQDCVTRLKKVLLGVSGSPGSSQEPKERRLGGREGGGLRASQRGRSPALRQSPPRERWVLSGDVRVEGWGASGARWSWTEVPCA